ncbi:MAG: hypothetical protein PHY95_00875 [Candidatus ainarchaeum sp.]|nr:hypothetical protein [Candidatus ainarchaeum sp.]
MESKGYFVAESMTRGALSRNYSAAGPSAARGIWVDIINFSIKKKAPTFAEIEPSAYYIGVVPPFRKGDESWKKPLAALLRTCGRHIAGPATTFHMGALSNDVKGAEPPSKWLPGTFAKLLDQGLFGTHILINVPYMIEYMEMCAEELGANSIKTDEDTGVLTFMRNRKSFSLDGVGLIKKMAYGGFTKEFLAASIMGYVAHGSQQKPQLSAVRRIDFPREKGIYSFDK